MLSSTEMSDTVVLGRVCVFADNLTPPSNDLPLPSATSERSRTRNDGGAMSFSLSAVDFRLPNANLGICNQRLAVVDTINYGPLMLDSPSADGPVGGAVLIVDA